jgi:hypothetical protein
MGDAVGVIIDTLKDALSLLGEDRRKAREALERVEELYYDRRIDKYDAFFMAMDVELYYVVPVWPRGRGQPGQGAGCKP